jgi:hypothetical protein
VDVASDPLEKQLPETRSANCRSNAQPSQQSKSLRDLLFQDDEPGKLAAVMAYANGWLTLEQTDALFALHPNWLHA